MTNPTPHGQVPEALRLADELDAVPETGADPQTIQDTAAELRRLHAYCQELEAQVIRDCMTHVQNPAEIEHVAGDVSKNGAELNMGGVYAELPRAGAIGYASVVDIDQYLTRLTIDRHLPGVRDVALWTTDQMRAFADATHALRAQQPAPAPQQEVQEPVMWAMWRESTGWLAASCEKTRDECIANCIEAAVSEGLPPDFAAARGWIPRPLYAPPASQGDALDAARLDWLLLHISGAEFRRIGVHYSGNARRADVDAARNQGGV